MGRKGSRHALERGISEDATGRTIRVKVTHAGVTHPREKRYPKSADLPYLRAERAQLEADLRGELQESEPAPEETQTRGTFAGDVATYLKRMASRLDKATWRSRASELKAWADVFGRRPRHTIRATDVERAIATWKKRPAAPRAVIVKRGRSYKPRPWVQPSAKTIQNRVRTLKHFYRTMNGKRARTPADDVELAKPVKTRPRAVSMDVIQSTLDRLIEQERSGRLRSAKTRARFLVLVTTGQRPAQIMRAQPDDVNLPLRKWWVDAAKGGEPVPLSLNDEMLLAWKLFTDSKAWGHYDTRSFARTLRSSGWPATVRPYNARHTMGIALSESGEDLGDVQAWMGHSQIQTTRTFYVPLLESRLKSMSDRLGNRLNLEPASATFAGKTPRPRGHRKGAPRAQRRNQE